MKIKDIDILIVGAGPVGLMCAYLAKLNGLNALAVDKSSAPLEVGRADALNARTLQLLELVGLFDELYPLGLKCNTSSVWANGKFVSRQSSWWDSLEGCFHKHFLMLGQSYIEKLLDSKLSDNVLRSTSIEDIELNADGCLTTLSSGEKIQSKYVIGADGSRSFVRNKFKVPFNIMRPNITWAVIDGIIDTDFPKVPEIIVFQSVTSDVAWIPREGNIDRFYIRMDKKEFTQEEVLEKINIAISPHTLKFSQVEWMSQFSVKESVAENFIVNDRVFLAGDSAHIHSVNGGQGLNTGLADAFNLIWKINLALKNNDTKLINTYESERKTVAKSVIDSSGELVRSTKYSETGTHAQDYVKIVEKRAGNITGMGVRYGEDELEGTRVFDFKLERKNHEKRLYTLLDYTRYTLLVFDDAMVDVSLPVETNIVYINSKNKNAYTSKDSPYKNQAVLVRPDSYIAKDIKG